MTITPLFPSPIGGTGTSPASGARSTPRRPMSPLTPIPNHMGLEQPNRTTTTQEMGTGPLEVPAHTTDPTTAGTILVNLPERTTMDKAVASTPSTSDETVDPDCTDDAILPSLDPLQGSPTSGSYPTV